MDLKEIGINMRNWIDWDQDRDYWRALEKATLHLLALQFGEFVTSDHSRPGSSSIENDAHGIEKLLLKIQVS